MQWHCSRKAIAQRQGVLRGRHWERTFTNGEACGADACSAMEVHEYTKGCVHTDWNTKHQSSKASNAHDISWSFVMFSPRGTLFLADPPMNLSTCNVLFIINWRVWFTPMETTAYWLRHADRPRYCIQIDMDGLEWTEKEAGIMPILFPCSCHCACKHFECLETFPVKSWLLAIQHSTLPCPALPCPAQPCLALPCPAQPCPAVPYRNLPYVIWYHRSCAKACKSRMLSAAGRAWVRVEDGSGDVHGDLGPDFI